MAKIDFGKLPRFSELPVRKEAPPESTWGVFGDNDEIGCVNLLTEEGVIEAARLVRKGKVFRLDMPINYANPPLFGRDPVKHTKRSFEDVGALAFDDVLDNYNTQEGSQWDSLGHVGSPRYQVFYNGVKKDEIRNGTKLGIHNWADKLVGRALLIDVCRYRNQQGRPINHLTSESIPLSDIKQALAAQGSELKPGTVLLVRTGWIPTYLAASPEQKKAMAPMFDLKACGIETSRDSAEWLWDSRVAAIATDCPAVEPWPIDVHDDGALHPRALSLLGLPLGEQFNLEPLAEDCAADGRYEFMLVSAPLNLVGGIASPANAVAIK